MIPSSWIASLWIARARQRDSGPCNGRFLIQNTKLAKDYAIVARIHDNVTGQPVIILAGILGEGTEAASEVVSNPAYLDAMLRKAPKNWDQLNLEAVIETNVIEGHAGPPTVLAVETW